MRRIQTTEAPTPVGPYSQAIVSGTDLVYVSGQLAIEPVSGKFTVGTIDDQTRQVLANVQAVLRAAGSDLKHAVRVSCYLRDIADFAAFNTAYSDVLGDNAPARTALQAAALPHPDALIEIDVIAEVP